MSTATLAEPRPLEPSPKLTTPFALTPDSPPAFPDTDPRLPTALTFAETLHESALECDGFVSPRDEALIAECVILYRRYRDRVRIETDALQRAKPGRHLLTKLKHASAIREARKPVVDFMMRRMSYGDDLADELVPWPRD